MPRAIDSTLWTWVVVLAITVAILAWIQVVRFYYRVRALPPRRFYARTDDGWSIALYERPSNPKRFKEPVVLCHGLANNRYTFDFEPPYSIAHFLSNAGFDCFTVELRGAGASSHPRGRGGQFCADDFIALDGPAIVRRVLEYTGESEVFWLGHSLGGLVGYGVAQGPAGSRLKGLLTLGAPVFYPSHPYLGLLLNWSTYLAWPWSFRLGWTSALWAPLLGYWSIPLSDVVVNPLHVPPPIQRKVYANLMTSVSRKLLLQLQDWLTHDAFRSFDHSTDFRAGIEHLSLPLLIMGGSFDQLAPPASVRAQFELAKKSTDKTLIIFGREHGEDMEYGHGDLLFGKGAPEEVYPQLRSWLEARATPFSHSNTRSPAPSTVSIGIDRFTPKMSPSSV